MYQWTGNVGLINVSDMLKASLNPACKSATDQGVKIQERQVTCNNNYLLEFTNQTGFWSINAFGSESGSFNGFSASNIAWYGAGDSGLSGIVYSNADFGGYDGVRPVIFLKSNTTLEGLGTSDSPFTIV